MDKPAHEARAGAGERRRRLRAVLAADVSNFGGLVSVDETRTLDALWETRRIATEELERHGGWLFGMPGDGIFALFESAVDAVRCALQTQARLSELPKLNAMRLRIGVHLGEVLFQNDLPFGEALVIAARLESLAEPGGILVSSAVMDAVAPRIPAVFTDQGIRSLKHSPRQITTFSVAAAPVQGRPDASRPAAGEAPPSPPASSGDAPDALAAVVEPEPAPAPEAPPEPPAQASQPSAEPQPADEPTVFLPRDVVTQAQALLARGQPEGDGRGQPAPASPQAPPPTPAAEEKAPVSPYAVEEMILRRVHAGPPPSPQLPRATPLVLPSDLDRTVVTGARSESAAAKGVTSSPEPVEVQVMQACLEEITQALMTHLGPFAKVLVKRHAARSARASDLIEALAGEIPAEAERLAFRNRAGEALARQRR